MRDSCKGSFTVEASVIVPTVLLMFVVLIYILFYYHDKNIISGAAYETVVVGTERTAHEEQELEQYFQSRIRGKLILFSGVKGEVQIEKKCVAIHCIAQKKRMQIVVDQSARRTEPESVIRNIRKVKR